MAPRKKLTAQLPAAFVAPDIKHRLSLIAGQESRSLSDVIREAIELFLAENDRKSVINASNTTQKETTP